MDVWCLCVYVRFSVFVYRPCDELITRPRSPTEYLRSSKPSETESFVEVGQGTNGAVAPKEKLSLVLNQLNATP
jgi:hypothetical protein